MTQDNKTHDFSQEKNAPQQEKKCKTMMRVSHNRENPFVMINSQALRHPSLTLKARGLWAYLLSFPDNWEINMSHLLNSLPEGRTAIYNAFDELIHHGFMVRLQYYGSRQQGTQGFQKLQYIIFEFPLTEEERKAVYEEFQQNCIHSGQIKNNSVHSGFVHAGFVHAENQLQRINEVKEDLEKPIKDSAPPSGASPPPALSDPPKQKKPSKPLWRTVELKERLPAHPHAEEFKKTFNTPLVGIADKDHEALVAKHGEAVIARAYDFLADWKLSKAEVDPRALKSHTDYHRLKKWALKEVLADPQKGTGTKLRPWAIEIDKKPLPPKEERAYVFGTYSEEMEEEIFHRLVAKGRKLQGSWDLGKLKLKTIQECVDEMDKENNEGKKHE